MRRSLVLLLMLSSLLTAPTVMAETGLLVVAPDRGFMGNEETREAFAGLAAEATAELTFVGGEDWQIWFCDRLKSLKQRGAAEVVALPLYVTDRHPHSQELYTFVADKQRCEGQLPVTWGRAFGASYLAVDGLAARLTEARAAGVQG